MGLLKKLFGFLIILVIIGLILYYLNLFGVKSIIEIPGLSSGTLPNYQFINSSYGNNVNANYSSQYKIALNITKKYNEPINKTILFTGNSTNSESNYMNQYLFSTQGTSTYLIKYNQFYIPTYFNITDNFVNGSSYIPSLIGKIVYLQLIDANYHNVTIEAPYTVQSEKIQNSSVTGKRVFWYLTQATGIPNSTAISFFNEANNKAFLFNISSGLIGIYYNETEILYPSRS
ncbi:MAG: hypothetical protein LVQ97_04760 [Candidatus Micrarchaeales archaeon]|jgi:hypothetical protein|uniref:Uncharacterized protein n=1 Tax=Candidatus Micrarchaeum acidiphilum ARMAN-2 TaxID=425595 RepID=C7DGY0_MICA2|nr:MAG: hypothetical protein UNLARM2_0330 [Candidatus Micrarchaeum acidiphilum ARMAN-2]MCW6161469.1 hypothetical protein [Candidatus Micrarchaeales archaeon]